MKSFVGTIDRSQSWYFHIIAFIGVL